MSSKGILGIENRTENWKTARTFAPFFRDDAARLRLAKQLGAPSSMLRSEVHIELFWKGMRDHFWRKEEPVRNNPRLFEILADLYVRLFPDLRRRIEEFDTSGKSLRLPQKWNYTANGAEDMLASNLINTEIDVVVDTPTHLFIGEAKEESGLDANGQYVLVHQLFRQYVMAWTLTVLRGRNRKVVPFVVGDGCKLDSLKNTEQVKFMQRQGWLKEENVLSWEQIAELARPANPICQG